MILNMSGPYDPWLAVVAEITPISVSPTTKHTSKGDIIP